MEYRTALLHLSRSGDALRVAFHEKNGSSESTLRPFELHSVCWEQINAECGEILTLLNRANRTGNQHTQTLANLKRSGEFLFDLLLPQSVKTKLGSATSDSLTLDLDDSLVHIPWQLLYDGREFLCRRFAMGRIVSTRQTHTARSERELKPPFSVLILADPRGDLEAGYREGVSLRNFLDERRDLFHVDFKSCPVDVTFVKKNLRDYDIVHYAGHAIYNAENPVESGWLLRDGTLSAAAVAGMGGSRPMPALVFANACQSAFVNDSYYGPGHDEQNFGLANAFLVAGVSHYIGSFGDIVDEVGGMFAKDFYAALAAGNAVGMALRHARLTSIDRFGEAQLNWSRYMLYGAPDFAFSTNSRSSPAHNFVLADHSRHSYALRGAESNKEIKVKQPRARAWIAASLIVAVMGLVGYSFVHWQRNKGPAAPQATVTALSAMNVSTLSNQGSHAPLRLSMQVIGQRKEVDGRHTEILVREGGTLRSGDQFQVHVETDQRAHIYVLLYDSVGHALQLFPDPKLEEPGFISAQNKLAIPDKHLWFWLDDHPGMETIYVLASAEPLKKVSELLAKMASVQPRPVQPQDPIKSVQRGVGGVAQVRAANFALADSSLIKQVTAVVVESGAVVRAISFRHE